MCCGARYTRHRNWIAPGREEPGSRALLAHLQGRGRAGHSNVCPSLGHG